MPHARVIVEFVGLPGAGKSTIAAALAARLAKEVEVDLPSRAEYRRKRLTLREKLRVDLVNAPRFLAYRVARLLYDVRKSGTRITVARNSWNRSRYPLVLLDRASSVRKSVYVLDEWLLHRTIDESVRLYESSTDFSTRFAILPRTSHRLIYVSVNVDVDIACQRVLGQDQPFRDFARDKDRDRIERTLALWQCQLEAVRCELQRRRCAMIDVDGSAPLDVNVDILHEQLRMIVSSTNCRTTRAKMQ